MGLGGCRHQHHIIDDPSRRVGHLVTQLVFRELMRLFHRWFPTLMAFWQRLISRPIRLSLLEFSCQGMCVTVISAVEEVDVGMMAAVDRIRLRRIRIY